MLADIEKTIGHPATRHCTAPCGSSAKCPTLERVPKIIDISCSAAAGDQSPGCEQRPMNWAESRIDAQRAWLYIQHSKTAPGLAVCGRSPHNW